MSIAYTDDHVDKGTTILTRTTITPENYPREVCGEQPYVPLYPTSEGGSFAVREGSTTVRVDQIHREFISVSYAAHSARV
jgi:hypothetical protein